MVCSLLLNTDFEYYIPYPVLLKARESETWAFAYAWLHGAHEYQVEGYPLMLSPIKYHTGMTTVPHLTELFKYYPAPVYLLISPVIT